MNNKEFTFWRFIQENTVEIPIIQRDYAQGRLGKEYLRKNFLNNIKQALDGKLPNGEKTLKLDYVYGSMAGGKLHPLDGQQRLTTLWLLHWYIAYKAGVLNEMVDEEKGGEQSSDTIKDVLKKFTYETRISSREFCEKLASFDIPQPDGVSIVEHIKNQTWFYSIWMQDPTIQSMLRMLGGTKIDDRHGDDIIDGLEEIFDGINDRSPEKFMSYWKILTCDSPIVFYYLPLENFGLSDDLYVKMNARGKQLTPFENFKADLINYLRRKKEEKEEDGETDGEWGTLLDPSSGINIKMDTDWLDGIFWKNRSSDNKVDEIYYAFMNRYFWNGLLSPQPAASSIYVQKSKENENPSYNYLNKDNCNEYNDLTPYMFDNGEIPISLLKDLQTVLDNYLKYNGEIRCAKWMENFSFIPQYEEEEGKTPTPQQVNPINQIQRILFFAICKYFKEGEADEQSLTRWMRVVCNLVSGRDESGRYQIRDISSVRTAIDYIDKLDSHHVYESLCKQEVEKVEKGENVERGTFRRRWIEEIHKALWILNNDRSGLRGYDGRLRKEDDSKYDTWEKIIINAENYAFFHGAIRFLFLEKIEFIQNEGKDEERREKWVCNWAFFEKKLENAAKYFNGVSETKSLSFLKDLIRNIDTSSFDELYNHKIFNTGESVWMYYLLNARICNTIHHFMLGEKWKLEFCPTDDKDYELKARILNLLSDSILLNFLLKKKITGSRIYDYYYNEKSYRALYPSHIIAQGIFLDKKNRDKFLLHTEGVIVDRSHKIAGKFSDIDAGEEFIPLDIIDKKESVDDVIDTDLLFGPDINFIYRERCFQWYRNDMIYLMEDNDSRKVNEGNVEKEAEKYYCFSADGKSDEDILKGLDSLLNQNVNDK